jgi:hypothetical protein
MVACVRLSFRPETYPKTWFWSSLS